MLDVIFTSMSGMNASQAGLDAISNNVANMNTPGFKLSNPLFRDLVNQFGNSIGTSTSQNSTKGGGVSVSQNTLSFTQGTFQDTGNTLSAAIDGSGFFVVDQNGSRLYTRAGQFGFDKDGILTETGTGAKVLVSTDASAQGYLDINTVRVYPPNATTEVTLSGSLMRTATGSAATSYSLPQIQINDTTGASMNLTAKLTPAIDTPGKVTTKVNLSGTLQRASGGLGTATAYTLPQFQVFDATGSPIKVSAKLTPDATDPLHWTVDILDASGTVLGSGDLRFNADGTPAAGSSSVSVPVTPTTGSAFNVTFDFGVPGTTTGVTSTTGTPTSLLTVASQDGAAPLVKDPLHWKVDILNDKNVVQGSGDIVFNDNGTPATGSSSFKVTITPATGPAFDVNFNFGAPGTYAGVTSVTGATASQLQVLKQDGVALGTITTNAFDNHGKLTVTYSNGKTKTVGTLVLARFDTPDQIKEVGGAHFAAVGAQAPILGGALDSGFGSISGGKIEMSNVDLTNEFTQLIIAQRGFQGSSQIISVANEMLQQLLTMSNNK